jgi:hypothetical protein
MKRLLEVIPAPATPKSGQVPKFITKTTVKRIIVKNNQ